MGASFGWKFVARGGPRGRLRSDSDGASARRLLQKRKSPAQSHGMIVRGSSLPLRSHNSVDQIEPRAPGAGVSSQSGTSTAAHWLSKFELLKRKPFFAKATPRG